jgi:hypothetical protein
VTGRRTALALLGVGFAGSQAGHLLAFQLRFGSGAQHLQSSGAHAYFPMLAKTTLGLIAAVFVGAIFLIGLARVLGGRSRIRVAPAHGYLELLAALFTIQLACFIVQESGEAMAAGVAVDSAPHLLLWGTLGQLPVAAIAGIALVWLLMRFDGAVDDLRSLLAASSAGPAPAPATVPRWPVSDRALIHSTIAGGPPGKRGPPASLRFSS